MRVNSIIKNCLREKQNLATIVEGCIATSENHVNYNTKGCYNNRQTLTTLHVGCHSRIAMGMQISQCAILVFFGKKGEVERHVSTNIVSVIEITCE